MVPVEDEHRHLAVPEEPLVLLGLVEGHHHRREDVRHRRPVDVLAIVAQVQLHPTSRLLFTSAAGARVSSLTSRECLVLAGAEHVDEGLQPGVHSHRLGVLIEA